MSTHISKKYAQIKPSATLAIDSKFKAMKAAGEDVVGFGAGEPDFETPDYIKEAGIRAIQEGRTRYTPASGTPELKRAIVQKLKNENNLDYEVSDIVVSNGAKHSLSNVFGAICDEGDEVIIPAPFWVSYPEMVCLAGGKPVILYTKEENGFKFTAKELEAAITPKTSAVVLNSPCNPTGMVYTEAELKEIADMLAEKDVYIIADEIYEHLIYDGGKNYSIASFNEEVKKRTIIVNGVSKSYAMTGWRIGYTASSPELAKVMSSVQSHQTSNPNSIAQYAATVALTEKSDVMEEMRKAFEERRNYMVERINGMEGLSCRKPQGAFYIMMNMKSYIGKVMYGKEIAGADDFAALFLEKEKVAVVPCESFGAPGYIRWSYATGMDQIKKGMDRLENFLKNANN